MQLFFYPILLITTITYFTLIIYYFAIQLILLIIYVLNWRYSLILKVVNWKKLIYLIIGIFVILAVLFSFNNYKYVESALNLDFSSKVFNFPYTSSNNSSPLIYISQMFMVLFRLENTLVKQYIWMLSFAIWCTCLVIGLYEESINYSSKKIWVTILSFFTSVFLLAVISLCLNPNLVYGLGWIIPCLLLILYLHKKSILVINNYNYVYLLNLVGLGLFFITPNSMICLVLINLYFLYANYKNKLNNLVNFNISMLFTPIFCFTLYFYYYLTYVWYVISCLVVIFYILYIFIKNTKLFKNTSFYFNRINQLNNDLIYLCLCLVFLLAISIFVWINSKFNFDIWVINQFMNKDISLAINSTNYYLVNVFWWIFNILLFVYAIAMLGYKLKTNLSLDKYNNLELTSYITIWNPIAIQFWTNQIPFGYYSILSVINLNVSVIINTINNKLFNFNDKKHLTWTISTLSFVTLSFIGLTLFNFLG